MLNIAIQADELDNVATVFAENVKDGSALEIRDKAGHSQRVTVIGDVPYGHKVAVCDIKKGEHIIKYGEVIGGASADIRKGEYVHIHNLEALRGRGDRKEDEHHG